MKKKLFLITTLAAAVAATTIPVAAAVAAETPTYPSSFVRSLDMSADGLTDYAINGDTYAFAVKTTIYVLSTDDSGDRKLAEFTYGTQITALDYTEGHLYFKSTSGNAYCYPDVTAPVEHEFPTATYSLEIGTSLYLLNNKTELEIFDKANGNKALIGEGFSSLKQFGDKVYAVKENCPYVLEGETATPLNLGYTDFSAADNISVGTLADELKADGYQIKTATLADGSYYTQIDPDNVVLYFRQLRTLKADGAVSCLVLASGAKNSDEIAVIVAGGNCYVTATKNLTFSAYTAPANDWEQGPQGQCKAYVRERTGIYASPYMCMSTRIAQAATTEPLAVTVEEKFSLDFIDTVFYRVSYKDANNKTVSGFVAAGYLDEYDYSADANKPTSGGTENFTYESNVTTVILVLVIVGLVIIAIVYLTIVGTKPDKNSKKKRKKKEPEEDDE